MFDSASRPRLRHCTLIDDPASTETTLVVGTDYFTLTRIGARDTFLQLKSLLDGRHSVAAISRRTGLSERTVIDVLDNLNGAGLFQSRTAAASIPAKAFQDSVEASSIMWRRQIGLHRLFTGLTAGQFRTEVFIGLLLETYHYVRLLPQALHQLTAGMTPGPIKDCVLDYALEEMDHHRDYRTALQQIDRIADHIDDAHPTVGTLSLIRNFEAIGRRSELSLICCLQLIEARASEMAEAEDNLRAIAAHYRLAHLMEPFIAHMKADIALGHSGLLARGLANAERIPSHAAHAAVNDMHDLKHCFDVFHDSVIGYYDDISNYIPRPRVDYFAL